MRRLVVMVLAALALAAPAGAFPEHTGFVTDSAHLIADGERGTLEKELAALEKDTTWEVAVVTVQTLEGASVERYAQDLFVSWGIGKKGTNNGVLLLVARQERKIRIHTGYHAESYIPDAVAKRIISDDIAKKTKQEDWSGGIVDGTRHIEKIVRDSKEHPAAAAPTSSSSDVPPEAIVFLVLFLLVIVYVVWRTLRSTSSSSSYYYGSGTDYSSGSSSSYSSSSSSDDDDDDSGGFFSGGGGSSSDDSGSFSFGGGDSGGGGASGDA